MEKNSDINEEKNSDINEEKNSDINEEKNHDINCEYIKDSVHELDNIIKNIETQHVGFEWLLNVESYYIRRSKIGLFGICEIRDDTLYDFARECTNNIFLYTGYKEWILLKNKTKFIIECEGVRREVWLCKIIGFEDPLLNNLRNGMSSGTLEKYREGKIGFDNIPLIDVIYGRCKESMTLLDGIYRDYVYRHKFFSDESRKILAIKSVAGSGKTTTLLELAKIHSKKRILYIAFNKSLISEIKDKISKKGIKNLKPCTFDSLMRDTFIAKTGIAPNIVEIKPQTLGYLMDFFEGKPYRVKNYYAKNYLAFCNQTRFTDMREYCLRILGNEKMLLDKMWDKTVKHELFTFDSLRKINEINHNCRGYIDANYDMIFIDESQDFDNIMLKILLEDTTIPKLFVGDPNQAIYEWRGCINAFDKLPVEQTLTLEFYSTFRVGEPACSSIATKFDKCWMISKSNNETKMEIDGDIPEGKKYVYLFRNWKNLLRSAQNISRIWINNYEQQVQFIKKLHEKLQFSKLNEEEMNEFSDDLPKFLLKMNARDLEKLLNSISENIVKREDCDVEMFTIHTYKGLESDVVRIFNDIDIKKEVNLHYVALTRGMKRIIIDKINRVDGLDNVIRDDDGSGKRDGTLFSYGVNCIVLD